MVSNDSSSYITSVERIYREVCKPSAAKPAPKRPDPPPPIKLEYGDVREILANKRSASIEELTHISENWKKFCLTIRQRNDISLRITIALAHRGRPAASPNAELYALLDLADTPVGLLHHRSWFERELRMGAQAISSCKLHRPPRCDCWRGARERLWLVQDKYGAKSPEAWAATKLYEQLEELEAASKPERTPGLGATLPGIPGEAEYYKHNFNNV